MGVMHFHTAQRILTQLGGDIHRVMDTCIGYIACAVRVRNGGAQRANVRLCVFLVMLGGIRASMCIFVKRASARSVRVHKPCIVCVRSAWVFPRATSA